MKKIITTSFVLASVLAHAQEGKVGVNNHNPKATLDIQPTTANKDTSATTNEGIIAPRLSKTRVANIADGELTEGTMVYVTDDAPNTIASYTGSNDKVTKITEKGYYFYNGTEWVKVQYNALASSEGSKWTTDTANNTVKLTNLSDGTTARDNTKNIIVTDNGEVGIGVYNNGNLGKLGVRNSLRLTDVPVLSVGTLINTNNNVSQGLMFYTDNTTNPARIDVIRGAGSGNTGLAFLSSDGAGAVERFRMTPDGKIGIGTTTPSSLLSVESNDNTHITVANTADDKNSQISFKNNQYTYSSGLHGGSNGFVIYDNTKSKYRMFIQDNGKTIFGDNVSPTNSKVEIRQTSGVDEFVLGIGTSDSTNNKVSKGIQFYTDNSAYPARIDVVRAGSSQETGLSFLSSNKAEPAERLRIEPNGNIKVNALAQTGAGDRVVYADENGILKTGSASITASNGVQNTTGMECNETNRGKMNFVQGEAGKSDVFGICMKNANGNYYWGYMVGGNNPTNGTGAFGSGL